MKIKSFAACVAVFGLMVPMFGHAEDPDSDRSHPGTFAKDSAITTKIKAKLANDKMSTLTNVHVDTDQNGAVLLSGTVKSDQEADRAMALARETEGVKSVKSEIRVQKEKEGY